MKLGAAQNTAPSAWRLVTVEIAVEGTSFGFWLNRKKLREVRRREGRYLSRINLKESDPANLQLVAVEEAFKTLKGPPQRRPVDPANRPIFHRDEKRVEVPIFIAFLAYCLHVTLGYHNATVPGRGYHGYALEGSGAAGSYATWAL